MKRRFLRLIKNKTFFKIWLGQLISLLIASMLIFVLVDKVYNATASTIAVGLVWGFFLLPSATLGPFTGIFVDHWSKKRIFIISSLIQAGIALLFLKVGGRIWFVYPIVLLYSFADEFFNPAVKASLPAVVRKKQLPLANTIFFFTQQTSIVVGYLLGGLLLRFWAFQRLPFWLASGGLLFGASLAFSLPDDQPATKKKLIISFSRLWPKVEEAFLFIRQEPKVWIPLFFLVGLQAALGTGLVTLPSVAEELFRIDFQDAPFLIVLPAIIGAILGGLTASRFLGEVLKRKVINAGLFVFSLSFLGLFAFNFIFPRPWFLGSFLILLLGFSFTLMFIPFQTLIQEQTPFGVRGRVFGILNALVTIAASLPVLLAATVIDFFGLKPLLLFLSLGTLLLAWKLARGDYEILLINSLNKNLNKKNNGKQ